MDSACSPADTDTFDIVGVVVYEEGLTIGSETIF